MPYWFEPTSMTVDIGGRTMKIETGKIAKQAAGAAVVTFGDTVVLVTAVHSTPRPGIDFFPLTVDYVEKFAAAGKIPGGFFKREGRLADREVLVSRFIDRSIRPLFADGFHPRRDPGASSPTALGTDDDAQRIDEPAGRHDRRFMLTYNFPPFCTGEARPLARPSAARSATAPSPAAASRPCCPSKTASPTSSAAPPRSSSRTARRRWRPSAAPPWRCSTRACRSRPPSPASRWASSRRATVRRALRHPRRRGPPRRHGLQGHRHHEGHHRLPDGHKIQGVAREIMAAALEQARAGRVHILGEMGKVIAGAPRRGAVALRPAHHDHPHQARQDPRHHRPRRQGHPRHPGRPATSRSTSTTPARSTSPRPTRSHGQGHADDPRDHPGGRDRRAVRGRGQAHRRLRRVRRDLPRHRRPHPHQPPGRTSAWTR
jgi:hypothetical protein